MAIFSAEVLKTNEAGRAFVAVEIVPSSGFDVVCDFLSPVEVEAMEGEAFESATIEVACMSGAGYARRLFPLDESRVVIRSAKGAVASLDAEGFAIATVLAIGRAIGREELIPEKAFQGAFGSWEPVD